VFKNVSPIFLFLTRNGTALHWNIYWHCKRNWINIVFQHSTYDWQSDVQSCAELTSYCVKLVYGRLLQDSVEFIIYW